jgi:exodeoxyribonuclease-3
MIIATWNINSARVRAEQLLDLLRGKHGIDVILLQEIKCATEAFPYEFFEDAGYNCAVFGQKSNNGVAILSKHRIEDMRLGSAVFPGDASARYVEALVGEYKISSVYVPNGQAPDTPQYAYKLQFLSTLIAELSQVSHDEKFVIGGDFNITRDNVDVYNPELWRGRICCTDAERRKLRELLDVGFCDCLRQISGDKVAYTWWDYRSAGFRKNNGLRLDYILATPNIAVKNCYVDLETRALERPSDHAPVIMECA